MKDKISLKELIELFTIRTIYDLNCEKEVPKLKFVFKEEDRSLFETVMKYPYKEEGWTSVNIEPADIEKVMESADYTCEIVNVPDALSFKYLTDITNSQLKLYETFNEPRIAREHCMYIMRRLWLRMGPNDLNDIERFLDKQLKFVRDDTLDDYRFNQTIIVYYGYPIKAKVEANRSWDESTRRMTFKIEEDSERYHSLPSILYDICEDTCYIYAIQKEKSIDNNRIPKIERLLYKLNKDVNNPTVHPSKVLSLKLFIDLLKENNINTIVVPTLQVLSYSYHEILSNKVKKKQRENEWDELWYKNVVDKQDLISESKTEKLIDTVNRVISIDDDLYLINDIDISDELIIKINNNEKNKIKQKNIDNSTFV